MVPHAVLDWHQPCLPVAACNTFGNEQLYTGVSHYTTPPPPRKLRYYIPTVHRTESVRCVGWGLLAVSMLTLRRVSVTKTLLLLLDKGGQRFCFIVCLCFCLFSARRRSVCSLRSSGLLEVLGRGEDCSRRRRCRHTMTRLCRPLPTLGAKIEIAGCTVWLPCQPVSVRVLGRLILLLFRAEQVDKANRKHYLPCPVLALCYFFNAVLRAHRSCLPFYSALFFSAYDGCSKVGCLSARAAARPEGSVPRQRRWRRGRRRGGSRGGRGCRVERSGRGGFPGESVGVWSAERWNQRLGKVGRLKT